MAADFSRVRLDPLLDYAGVELKQGGVLLDADANELVAIVDRRLRALAGDTLGRSTVSATTPNAFKISASGGTLQIDKGRLYVDGLLAENHGKSSTSAAKRTFDSLLAEGAFTDAIDYAHQPYLPSPAALPSAGRHLVYLDVWDREVTHLENPKLVESAVAVETSSRIQTVWQVRVLPDVAGAGVSCSSPDGDVAGWTSQIAPSTGVLSTGTFDVAPTDDPCELPPTGGYRGLENQLYRVEIHDAGLPGGSATFKWSRENASVGSRVASMISGGELELASLGRDEVLCFNTGDWVEIVDDVREFSQSAGELRRITVDNGQKRISFAPALPAAMLPGSFPSSDLPNTRNLRVRRWDQKGLVFRTDASGKPVQVQDLDQAGSSGAIKVPSASTTLLLEQGVTVSFASTGQKGFKAGDYWVFAARTADASVEVLDHAAPRGIHHHFARLAFWEVATGNVTDCRNPWPPPTAGADCGCTRCVTPKSHASGQLTIQDAVSQLIDSGGTVCLHTGQYSLSEPVRIVGGRSLRIHGQGPASVITSPGGAFLIDGSAAIAIEDLSVVSLGRASAIHVRNVVGLSLRELVIASVDDTDAKGAAIGLSGVVAGAAITDNLIIARDGIRDGDPAADDNATNTLITAALRAENNVFLCQHSALALRGTVAHMYETRVCDNQVLGCRAVGLETLGVAVPGASVRISDNTLQIDGAGIRCAADQAWIEGNKLSAVRSGKLEPLGSAIGLPLGLTQDGIDQCQILSNQISGFPDAAILIDAPTRELIIKHNLIDSCGNGILMTEEAAAGALSIENNHLRNIEGARGDKTLASGTVGITVSRSESVAVVGNTLRQVGQQITQDKQLIAGILALSVRRLRISGNEVTELGPLADFGGVVAGIMVRAPYEQADVAHNRVERDAQIVPQSSDTSWFALLVGDRRTEPTNGNFTSRVARYATLQLGDLRTLVLNGTRAFINVASALTGAGAAADEPPASAAVLGNVLIARGRMPAVEVTASNDVLFSDNRVELRANQSTTAVRLNTPVAIIHGNRVRGAEISITVSDKKALVAAIGNITTNGIDAPLKPEMTPLNLIG